MTDDELFEMVIWIEWEVVGVASMRTALESEM